MHTSHAQSHRSETLRSALERNLAAVRERITSACDRAGRPVKDVRLLAVTKYVGPDIVDALPEVGLCDVGENYVQAALEKRGAATDPRLRWHLIGHLQSNKVRKVVGQFASIQTVDTPKLARRIATVAGELDCRVPIFLQVNTSGESAKTGCEPDDLPTLIECAITETVLDVVGLMTMGPAAGGPQASGPCFATLRELARENEKQFGLEPLRLSMGMSGDLEIAVEEGSTDVRVGSALYEGIDR